MQILSTNSDLCVNCYACVRVCPVNAISFQNGKVDIRKEDCILCGSCVRTCTQGAKVLYDDLPLVKNWITSGEKVAAIVAPSFAASFLCHPHQLIAGLRTLGFNYVLETAFGAEICAYHYQKLLSSSKCPIITTTCPAVILMVEKHFPQLINLLAPIKSPMMITGDYAKENYAGCKTVFIGPCIAKKAEAVNPQAGCAIDAVINFKQLKQWLKSTRISLCKMSINDHWDTPGANMARLLPISGGLLKTIGLHQDVASLDVIEASGPVKCKSILRSINSGSLSPIIADLLACDGCTSGPKIAINELCFNKTKNILNYTESARENFLYPREFAKFAPNISSKRNFKHKNKIKKIYSERQIWQVLNKTGKYTDSDLLNCGACGYDTCRGKAIAVLNGKADVQMCLPFLLQQYKEFNQHMIVMLLLNKWLEEKAAIDPLTGLYNHRTFHQRLDEEILAAEQNTTNLALYIIDLDDFKRVNDLYGHQAGDKVLIEVASIIKEVFKISFVARYGGEEFAVIFPHFQDRQQVVDLGWQVVKNIKNKLFTVENGVGIYITASVGISCFPKNATVHEDLIKQADFSMYAAKRSKKHVVMYSSVLDELTGITAHGDSDIVSTIKTLNIVINAKDQYTYKHSERVVCYAEMLARNLELTTQQLDFLRYGAFLHDIGKINIDMSILLKSGPLTEDEYKVIKKHPVVGAEIAKKIPSLRPSIPVILYHHERYDGQGYPYGLKEHNIPLFGRIAAIADSFDAMTTERPYKKAMSFKEALTELYNNAGTQFDPELVDIFISKFPYRLTIPHG